MNIHSVKEIFTEAKWSMEYPKLNSQDIEIRKTKWKPPLPKIKEGWLYRYSLMVGPASTGAILK